MIYKRYNDKSSFTVWVPWSLACLEGRGGGCLLPGRTSHSEWYRKHWQYVGGSLWEERINVKKKKESQVYGIMKGSPQFLSVKRGWFVGRGSGTVTSKPAAAIWPVAKASYRSSWFTTPPLTTAVRQIGNNLTLMLDIYNISSIYFLQTHIHDHLSLLIN